jgi:hypothetical protein
MCNKHYRSASLPHNFMFQLEDNGSIWKVFLYLRVHGNLMLRHVYEMPKQYLLLPFQFSYLAQTVPCISTIHIFETSNDRYAL